MHKLILPISRAVLLKCPTLAGKFSDRRAPQCLRRRYAKAGRAGNLRSDKKYPVFAATSVAMISAGIALALASDQ